jgi:hypothetical protein
MWTLKVILIVVFALILWQDFKERLVYWFLYPTIGVLAFYIHYLEAGFISALVSSIFNLLLISIVLIVAFLYAKLILKNNFVNGSIGLGDLLLFIFISFSFATVTFIILFVFSLVFSLLLHLYLKEKSPHNSVPLAGYMCLFFACIYLMSFFIEPKYLFAH